MGAVTIKKHGRSSTSQKGRGKLFCLAVAVITVCLSVFSTATVVAQMQKGDMAAGINLGIALNTGMGAKFQYAASEKIRLQGALNCYLVNADNASSKTRIGFDADMHYMFSSKKIAPYFVLGLGVIQGIKHGWITDGDGDYDVVIGTMPAFNLGGGVDFGIGNNLAINFRLPDL